MPIALIILLACPAEPVDDATLHANALAARSLETGRSFCVDIQDPSLRSQCLLDVHEPRGGVTGDLCGELDGKWTDQCWFQVAEQIVVADQAAGLAACTKAGQFKQECLYHCWLAELRELARQASGTESFQSNVAKVSEVARTYSQLSTAQHVELTVWNDFWFFYWERNLPVRSSACALVDDPVLSRHCQAGARMAAERIISETLSGRYQGQKAAICSAQRLPDGFPDVIGDDAELKAREAASLQRFCGQGSAAPWNPNLGRQ